MNKKPRSPLAYLLDAANHSSLATATLLEEGGFALQQFVNVASLVEAWVNPLTVAPSLVAAPAQEGGLVLARLRHENFALSHSMLVLLDDTRDVATAIQAVRFNVSDYVLLDAPTEELQQRISHLFSQLNEQTLVAIEEGSYVDTDDLDATGETSHITWDESLNAVRRGDTWISLSPIEWRLFHTLVSKRGAVVSLDDLVTRGLQRSSGAEADVPLLRLHISRLRSKLNENFGHELNVVTLRGRGYMLV